MSTGDTVIVSAGATEYVWINQRIDKLFSTPYSGDFACQICSCGLYTGQDWLLTVEIQEESASGYSQTIAPPPVTWLSTTTGGSRR